MDTYIYTHIHTDLHSFTHTRSPEEISSTRFLAAARAGGIEGIIEWSTAFLRPVPYCAHDTVFVAVGDMRG